MEREEAVRTLAVALDALVPLIRRTVRDVTASFASDLPRSAWTVLECVCHNAPVQSRAIAEAIGMDRGALSRHLKDLRGRGLIETVRDESDARIVWVTPTDDAIALRAASLDRRAQRLRNILEGWDTDEVTAFAALFDKFAQTVVHVDPPAAT